MGLNQSGAGTVNGTTVFGSDLVRPTSTTEGYLPAIAWAASPSGCYQQYLHQCGGGIPRRAGYAENWIATNPQFLMRGLATKLLRFDL